MLLCLVAAWFIVWLCVFKGIKTSGKVMYVTATFPYIVMLIFFIRAATLSGAKEGLALMFTPKIEKLKDPNVWLDAASQIFYSLSLAFGGIIAFSSYNPPHNNVMRDVYVLSGVNLFTSVFTAVIIFCILGFKGHKSYMGCLDRERHVMARLSGNNMYLNTSFLTLVDMKVLNSEHFNVTLSNGVNGVPFIEAVRNETRGDFCDFEDILSKAGQGTGLAFIAFTEVVDAFPASQLWSLLFFLMLLSLGLGSMFGTLECCITSIYDLKLFPWMGKPLLTGILCGFSCFVGLLFVTRAGEYWVKLFDAFAGSYGLMAVAICEVFGIVYIYGWRKFCDDIQRMTGTRPNIFFQICWRFIDPLIMTALFISSVVTSFTETPKYPAYSYEKGEVEMKPWPAWALIIACFLVIATICPVPIVFFIRRFKLFAAESDIPTALRNLNTTPSTVQILRSQSSIATSGSTSQMNTARSLS